MMKIVVPHYVFIIWWVDDKGRTATPVEDEVKASTPHSIDRSIIIVLRPIIIMTCWLLWFAEMVSLVLFRTATYYFVV